LIFNMADPDFRWIGNEDGVAPVQIRNTVDALDVSIYSDEQIDLDKKMWLPAECDVQMRDSWFYSDQNDHTVKSVDELIGIYYHSVGRGANLLLNIGPDRQGLLPEPDVQHLLTFSRSIKERFRHPIATLANCSVDNRIWTCKLSAPQLLNHAVIKEDVRYGEHVEQFKLSVETRKSKQWITVHKGENIGSNIIITFPPIMTNRVRLEITECSGDVRLSELNVYYVGE